MHVNIFSKLRLIFCRHQWKIQAIESHFQHFNDHNSWSKHVNQTNDPFFHLLFELSSLVYFIFAFSKFISFGSPPLHYFLVCKIHIYMPKITLLRLLTQLSFFYIKFASFWYMTCFVHDMIRIWPRSHGLLAFTSLILQIQLWASKIDILFLSNLMSRKSG